MVTEGRILTQLDVTGGNPVRTVVVSTTANDEGAPSNKDQQVMALGDPTTPANLAKVDAGGNLSTHLGSAATVANSSPGMTAVVASILTANANRLGATIYNDKASNAQVYVGFGAAASLTAYFVVIDIGGYLEVPFGWTGAISGICATGGTATLRVNELTA